LCFRCLSGQEHQVIGHPRTSVITVNNTGPSCAVDQGAFLKEFQLRFRHIVSQPRTMRPIYSYEFTVAALAGNTAPNVNPPSEGNRGHILITGHRSIGLRASVERDACSWFGIFTVRRIVLCQHGIPNYSLFRHINIWELESRLTAQGNA